MNIYHNYIEKLAPFFFFSKYQTLPKKWNLGFTYLYFSSCYPREVVQFCRERHRALELGFHSFFLESKIADTHTSKFKLKAPRKGKKKKVSIPSKPFACFSLSRALLPFLVVMILMLTKLLLLLILMLIIIIEMIWYA